MSKRYNVLYLSYDGLTDPLGQSQVISYLKELAKRDFNIVILSYEKPEVFRSKKGIVLELLKNTGIEWHPLSYSKKPPVLSTLKDLFLGWRKVKQLFGTRHFDIIHCRGYITPFLGLKGNKKYGSKVIFDMRGWWPDEKLESGFWDSPMYKPVYNYFKKAERRFFAESDFAVSLTQAGKDEILKLNYKDAPDIGVIPTCVNFDIFKAFDPGIRKEIRKSLLIPENSKVLLYSGSLGGNYGTDILMDLFKVLKMLDEGAILLILSKTDKAFIKSQITAKGIDIDDVRIVDVDYPEVYKYLMAGDFGVVVYRKSYSAIGRSPTKMGEYWACGLPVIALGGIGDLDYLLEKYNEGGVLIKEQTIGHYKEVLNHILKMDTTKDTLRSYAKDYYDLEKGANEYRLIYQKLVGE